MRGDFLLFVTVLKTLAKIGPNADPVFRDECTTTPTSRDPHLFTTLSFLPPPSLSLHLFPLLPTLLPLLPPTVIIPLLTEAAQNNNRAPNITQRQDVARILLEAYRGISHCCIFLPTLPSLMHSSLTF